MKLFVDEDGWAFVRHDSGYSSGDSDIANASSTHSTIGSTHNSSFSNSSDRPDGYQTPQHSPSYEPLPDWMPESMPEISFQESAIRTTCGLDRKTETAMCLIDTSRPSLVSPCLQAAFTPGVLFSAMRSSKVSSEVVPGVKESASRKRGPKSTPWPRAPRYAPRPKGTLPMQLRIEESVLVYGVLPPASEQEKFDDLAEIESLIKPVLGARTRASAKEDKRGMASKLAVDEELVQMEEVASAARRVSTCCEKQPAGKGTCKIILRMPAAAETKRKAAGEDTGNETTKRRRRS